MVELTMPLTVKTVTAGGGGRDRAAMALVTWLHAGTARLTMHTGSERPRSGRSWSAFGRQRPVGSHGNWSGLSEIAAERDQSELCKLKLAEVVGYTVHGYIWLCILFFGMFV